MASTSTDQQVRTKAASNWHSWEITDAEKELIKVEFNENIQQHFLSTRASKECSKTTDLWSYNCLNPLILRIQNEEKNTGQCGTYIFNHEDKSMVVGTWNGIERLFLKDEDGKFKVILPLEDIFDVFWEAHVKYCHPGTETLINILQDDYIVNDFATQQIHKVCYKCTDGKPYMRCALDILCLNGIADYAFTQIMVCTDIYTGYVHLRPISSDLMESEICMELLKIFMDFGPPKEVLISNDIYCVALDQLTNLTRYAPFSLAIRKVKMDYIKSKRLAKTFLEWMKNNEFENWSIACYGVQSYLNLNSRIKEVGQKSPYDMVFKKIERCVVEDLNDVEFDSFELPSSSNVNTDKGVFTTFSPRDFNVVSKVSGGKSAAQATRIPSCPGEEVQLINDEIMADVGTSDDDPLQVQAKDPLAIDWDIDI